MERRRLGNTDMEVLPVGIGLAELGFELTKDQVDVAAEVLKTALDAGINFLDTAGCYGISEELIGATVSARRNEYFLASKTGHMDAACDGDSWGYDCVSKSIDRSLSRLKTSYVDLMQLHSCDITTLERGEAIEALKDARNAGKIRYLGYSGDNDAVIWAAESDEFDVIQTSFSPVDQKARHGLFDLVRDRGLGLIAKRPIANAAWARAQGAAEGASALGEYVRRAGEIRSRGELPGEPDDAIVASLGFTLQHPEVHVAIVGSRNKDHVKANVEVLHQLPLEDAFVEELHTRFDELGKGWDQKT